MRTKETIKQAIDLIGTWLVWMTLLLINCFFLNVAVKLVINYIVPWVWDNEYF